MKIELFIARKLKIGGEKKMSSSPILNIALISISLALVIMILSITIVCGFKHEIVTKIYNLEPHIRVSNGMIKDNSYEEKVKINDATEKLRNLDFIKNISPIIEKSAILKTDSDFKGIVVRGVDGKYDFNFLNSELVSGHVPEYSSNTSNDILLSSYIAKQLNLKLNDFIQTYFIGDKIRVRKLKIVGIYQTDFEAFDKNVIVADINILRQINGWKNNDASYLNVSVSNPSEIMGDFLTVNSTLNYNGMQSLNTYRVDNIEELNLSYFSWLKLLDMNVVIILSLMIVVSAFTLIAALLTIVLDRINLVGVLKSLGGNNRTIRRIFVLLTYKLIFKALIIGNAIGLLLSYIQYQFRILRLNPEAYYMGYVPVQFNWWYLLALNIGILILAYVTLLLPSYIISSIKPSSTIKYE